mgnify:CR=1 FL=1
MGKRPQRGLQKLIIINEVVDITIAVSETAQILGPSPC